MSKETMIDSIKTDLVSTGILTMTGPYWIDRINEELNGLKSCTKDEIGVVHRLLTAVLAAASGANQSQPHFMVLKHISHNCNGIKG